MKVNIHPVERIARVVMGVGVVSLVFWGPETPWAWFGLVPLITGLTGYCPPYHMLGISTCAAPKPAK